MAPEDKLDTLLSTLHSRGTGHARADDAVSAQAQESRDGTTPTREVAVPRDLAPLFESAQRLASLRTLRPDQRFARTLEARILARAAERLPQQHVALPEIREDPHKGLAAKRLVTLRRAVGLRPALAAAALLVCLGLGTLAAVAMAAEPGNPLFGLRRLEQHVQAGMVQNGAASAQQHLQFARQWLTAVAHAATQHRDGKAYGDALTALRDEDTTAAQEISQLPPSSQRDALEAELSALHADERTTLQAALITIDWPDRISTTQALGTLGVAVPRLSGATIMEPNDGNWQVIIDGEGIESGAELVVGDEVVGSLTAASDGSFTAELSSEDTPPASLIVANPDGTAASTDHIQVLHTGAATPTPNEQNETPQPDQTPPPSTTPAGER